MASAEKTIERALRQQNPGFGDLTIKVMVAYQVGGWARVNTILDEMSTPGISQLLGMEER